MSSRYTSSLLAELFWLLKTCAIVAVVFLFLMPAMTYLDGYDPGLMGRFLGDGMASFLRDLLQYDARYIALIQGVTGSGGAARGVGIFAALVAVLVLGALQRRFTPVAKIETFQTTDVPLPEKRHTAYSNVKSRPQLLEVIREAQRKIDSIESTADNLPALKAGAPATPSDIVRKTNRDRLMVTIAEAKARLEEMQRDLAFLSIDVVGSTKMKANEERMKIETDFRNYKNFVNKLISDGGALTTAWTPDGIMVCFLNADVAVGVGKSVIKGLQRFNKEVKTIRTEFQVRCGVNAGRVYYDPQIPMEEMSDEVIDIAGHMQKYAAPNSIFISDSLIVQLAPLTRQGFRLTQENVDGLSVYQWN